MEEDYQERLRGTATVGSKERGERMSRISASSAQRTSVENNRYVVYGYIKKNEGGGLFKALRKWESRLLAVCFSLEISACRDYEETLFSLSYHTALLRSR